MLVVPYRLVSSGEVEVALHDFRLSARAPGARLRWSWKTNWIGPVSEWCGRRVENQVSFI